MPNRKKSYRFVAWCEKHITGDAKGQAEFFSGRLAERSVTQPDSRKPARNARSQGRRVIRETFE